MSELKYINARLSLLQFLQFIIWGAWFVTAGTYLFEQLSFNGRQVGLIYGSFAIAATITPFILGAAADRFFSTEKLLGILHLVGAILLFGMSQAQSFFYFYLITFLYVLCYLPTFSLSNALCFQHIPDAKNDFPKVRVWGTIAWIFAGFLVGGLAIENTAIPFMIAGGCSIIHGLYCFTLPKTPPQQNKNTSFLDVLRSDSMKELLKDKSFKVLIVATAFICIPTSYYYAFVNPFLNEMGVSNAAGKMALGQVTEIIFMLMLPWFFKNFKLKHTMFVGLLLWGTRYFFFIFGIGDLTESWFILGILVHGVAFTLASFSAQIYIDKKVPDELRSTAQGFYTFLTMGLMALLGTYIAGESVLQFTAEDGSRAWDKIWLIPSVVGVLVAVGFLVFFKPKK